MTKRRPQVRYPRLPKGPPVKKLDRTVRARLGGAAEWQSGGMRGASGDLSVLAADYSQQLRLCGPGAAAAPAESAVRKVKRQMAFRLSPNLRDGFYRGRATVTHSVRCVSKARAFGPSFGQNATAIGCVGGRVKAYVQFSPTQYSYADLDSMTSEVRTIPVSDVRRAD